MNIIFEGVDASGKTTTMNSFASLLDNNNEKFVLINELEDSPLSPVLKQMFQNDPFLSSNMTFKTSAYESLVLAASHFYKQEYMRNNDDKIVLYDRDFMTILAYQKGLLESEYPQNYEEFYEPFKRLILFDLKPVDLLVYLQVPIEVSIQRIISRGREKPYTKEQIEFLKKVKSTFENELIPELIQSNMNIIKLNGEDDPKENSEKIYRLIRG